MLRPTVKVPICKVLPETNVKSRPMVDVPNDNAIESVRVTSLVPLFESETAPVKLLLAPLVVKLMLFAPALKLEVPGTTNVPVCEIAPFETIVKLLPTVDAARDVAMLLVKVTAFAPLLDNVIAPVKLFEAPLVVKSIAKAPALKLDKPGTTNAPVCEIAPFETIVKLLPTVDAASEVARLFVKVTAFAPLFDKVIAPV